MVSITYFIGAVALLFNYASALPRPDSSINEPAVSAPDGVRITESDMGTATPVASYAPPAATSTSMSAPQYGSGSSNWGSSGYNDCVSQCMASFGMPPPNSNPSPTMASDVSGSGATHTVIVAPTQGVLRYVPFAVNASVGDTVKFMWGANNHTVTKGSVLLPCNASLDAPIASGLQLKDFVFDVIVNDTNPLFFHCAVPGHCQKGMFGIINPPNAEAASPSSVSGMMQSISANNSAINAYSQKIAAASASDQPAGRWGGNIDMGLLPDWAHESVAENVLYTRNFLLNNQEVMDAAGKINLDVSSPLKFPEDIAASSNAAPSSSLPTSSLPTSSLPAVAATNTPAQLSNGASSIISPRSTVAVVALIATFILL